MKIKNFINSGIYVVNPNINQFFKLKKFFHMTEFIESAILKKKKYIYSQFMNTGMIMVSKINT